MGAEGAKMASNFEDVLISQASGQSKAYCDSAAYHMSLTFTRVFFVLWFFIYLGTYYERGTHYVGNFKRD